MGTYLCLVATAELSRLPSHPLAVGPLCMLLERCPRVPCVYFRPGGAKERQTCGLIVPRAYKCLNYWRIHRHGALLPTSHGSQLVCMPHPTFPQQPASSSEVHPSPGLLTILSTSFPKPPRPEIVRFSPLSGAREPFLLLPSLSSDPH